MIREQYINILKWCNKGRGMCYPGCGDDAYKITLAANRKE